MGVYDDMKTFVIFVLGAAIAMFIAIGAIIGVVSMIRFFLG